MACQALLYWITQHNRLAYHCAVAAAALVAGCDSVSTSKHQTGSGTTVAVHFDRVQFEREREEYRREADQRIVTIETRLAELNRQADGAAGDAKVRMQRELDEQRPKLERAKAELKEIDAVVGEKWGEFKRRSSAALDDLQQGFERAIANFRD